MAARRAPPPNDRNPSGLRRRGPADPLESAEKRAGRRPSRRPAEEANLSLQLAIGREGIGLELAHPARLACLTVTELSATLPGVRFPVDVSGGVPRFRHRRGQLQRLQLELPVRALEHWASPKLRGVVGTRSPEVWVAATTVRATVCVSATGPLEDAPPLLSRGRGGTPVVAFDLHLIAEDLDLVLVVEHARGVSLPAPATAIAIACVEAVLGGVAARAGAAFVLRQPAHELLKALLPEAGARVPATDEIRWAALAAHGDMWGLYAARAALAHVPDDRALLARETARMLREADDALVEGRLSEARSAYIDALERAPRHPEIARRIVDIDVRAGGRAEAALSMLAESRRHGSDPAARAPAVEHAAPLGTAQGQLLADTGDVSAAIASLERAGDTEPAPRLSARAYELAAELTRDPELCAQLLDKAVARAPRSTSARWARVASRLQLGRLEDAIADVQHLEALARGGRARYAAWLRAGLAWQSAGLGGRAGPLFERALRFAPEEPGALAGLGIALLREGRDARGVALLTQAYAAAESRGEPTSAIELELARAMAEKLGDLPTAIARIGAISADAAEAPVARGLEGRWRARLGDVAGAALAFARLREFAASLPPGADHPAAATMASLLDEASQLHRHALSDALGAQRHLAVALRLRPHDEHLRRAYREVGALLLRGTEEPPSPPPAPAPEVVRPQFTVADDAGSREARVEELTRRLQANARDDAAADELVALLEVLGKGHELLALVSARLEDATPDVRAHMAPSARAALLRLAAQAQAEGRAEEASLFQEAVRILLP